MLRSRYQIISIGRAQNILSAVRTCINKKVEELGLDPNTVIRHINAADMKEYQPNEPTVILFWSEKNPSQKIMEKLSVFLKKGVPILPLVPKVEDAGKRLPQKLAHINAIRADGSQDSIDRVTSRVLELLGLLRPARSIFISYKRSESSAVAIQLYEHLDILGYNVFLDTLSINAGVDFQENMWHRFADTEVVVLLDTKNFLESKWTTKELGRASAMSIGLLQIVWPDHIAIPATSLCEKVYLEPNSFKLSRAPHRGRELKEGCLKGLGEKIEALRARSLAARQEKLVGEFLGISNAKGISAVIQPERYISLTSNVDKKRVAIIPTIGVPEAFLYNKTNNLIKSITSHRINRSYLLYDQICVRDEWLKHLRWLDDHLPVRTLSIHEVNKKILRL